MSSSLAIIDTRSLVLTESNDGLINNVRDEVGLLLSHSEVRGEAESVLATVDNAKTVATGNRLQRFGVTVGRVLRAKGNRSKETSAGGGSEDVRVTLSKLVETVAEVGAHVVDVVAEFRSHGAEHLSRDIERAGVGGHGVAVEATGVDFLHTRTEREHGKRELTNIDSLGEGFKVRGGGGLEARVVHEREHTTSTETGLDGVNKEKGAVLVSELTSCVIELTSDGKAGVAFAHDRLHEHRLNVETTVLNLLKGAVETRHVVGLDGEEEVLLLVE